MNQELDVFDQINFEMDLDYPNSQERQEGLEKLKKKTQEGKKQFLKYCYEHMNKSTSWKEVQNWLEKGE